MPVSDAEIDRRRDQQQNRPMPAAGRKDVADDENIAAQQQAGDRDQGVAAFRIVPSACPQRHREAKIIAQAAEERQNNRDQRLRIHDRQKKGN